MPIGSTNWIEKGMLGGVENVETPQGHFSGFRFRLRNQIFHGSHPLGWMRKLTVDLDGQRLAPDSVTFVLRNQRIPSTLIPDISDIWWQPREVATIIVDSPGGLPQGVHTLGCELEVTSPVYTPVIDRRDFYKPLINRLELRVNISGGTVKEELTI